MLHSKEIGIFRRQVKINEFCRSQGKKLTTIKFGIWFQSAYIRLPSWHLPAQS